VEIINKQSLTIDLKKTTMIPLPQFIQHDTNVLEFIILENGVAADLTNIGRIVVKYKRPDGLVVDRLLVAQGNTISYEIGISEMQLPGFGHLELHFYNLTNAFRISTKKFKVYMSESIGATYIESEQLGVLQELFVEVQELNVLVNEAEALRQQNESTRQTQESQRQTNTTNAISNLNSEVNKLKLDYKSPVANFADIATTYPNPQLGWIVQVTQGTESGKFYRFNGASWQFHSEMNNNALTDIQNKLAQTNRKTQTLIQGPYNVLNGEVNAPVNIQVEGRTLIPMQNNVLDATKFYVLADKRTWLKWADASFTKGVAKFTAKAEKPTLVAIANYGDKVAGSTLENPHISRYRQSATTLLTPTEFNSIANEISVITANGQNGYGLISSLNGVTLSVPSTAAAGAIGQESFSEDIIQEIERRFGRIPRATLAAKIQWAKDNVQEFRANFHGWGVSPAGNKATFKIWQKTAGAYDGAFNLSPTHSNASVTKLSIAIPSGTITNYIDDNGFAHFIAHADPATGNAGDANGGLSTINTDYFDLEIELKPDAVLHDPRVPLYEVTQAHYDQMFTTMLEDEIIARYPSVAGPTHLQNPYLIAEGENLLPPFYEWVLHANTKVLNPYELEFNATANAQVGGSYKLKVVPNTNYILSSVFASGQMSCWGYKTSSYIVNYSNTAQSVSFNSGINDELLVEFRSTSSSKFTFTNPMLTLGSVAKPFVPRNPSYLFFETKLVEIRGLTADRVFEQEGKYLKRKNIETVELDGSFAWNTNVTDYQGFKLFRLPYSGGVNDTEIIVKYNGLVLNKAIKVNWSAGDVGQISATANTVYITASDTDTGFGETYLPTVNEVKGWFNGWKAKTVDANGKPTAWMSIVDGTDAPTQTEAYVAANKSPNYTPYKLMFQLAAPKTEEIKYEGSIFANGLTMVDVGGGIVFREKVTPPKYNPGGGDYYYINHSSSNVTASLLKNRLEKFLKIYKNSEDDTKNWIFENVASSSYGKTNARIEAAKFDPNAEYTVTYVVYDKQTFTSNPVNVTAQYANNIRTALEDTAKKVEDVGIEQTVIKNTYAKKSKYPWIAPTLLNAWVNFGGAYATVGYTKDDFGYVHIRGLIKSGTIAQAAFVLPVGFRPEKDILIATTSNGAFGQLSIRTDGQVFVESGSNINFSLEGILFRTEG
jgi:hypothetical protein